MAKRFPEDTLVQFNYLPTLRAKLALSRGNASEAIESLRPATPYELGQTTYSNDHWTAMYPVYVRGQAYLAAHQGTEAAAEFQKILDHRGIVVNEPHWRAGALADWPCVCAGGTIVAGRGCSCCSRQSPQDISGFPQLVEGCRSQHSDAEASQGRIRDAAISG